MSIRVGIVGGQGQMGQWFKRFFEEQGLEVLVTGSSTTPFSPEVARQVDVAIISVPIHITEKTIREIAPCLRPEALLMDLTSLKKDPMAAMLEYFPGEVVGTHPLFGPGLESIKGSIMVLCPGRGERWFNWLHDLLARAGAIVQITTPEEHDIMMSVVQGLTHFILIAMGTTLRTLNTKVNELENFATPTFRKLFGQVQHLFNQKSDLYACIQLRNQANQVILAAFEAAVADIRRIVVNQDAASLISLLEENRRFFNGFRLVEPMVKDQ
ncbi:MAG: prephenate dehydrogenase/arogenate dehydrogenase family protein [Deltaproteobacteria bacterium]|nr:prephenate dehydrogenase/arogenate dehydrogenase family protein [Deltaproteobacteria bacterium]MBW1952445.1 prephenate dehydrogenase/arogenate dehydrogenase family protein [Deltaproteobacteria bacterium]MBW1986689.1 prephenate dehydrogenase/arogenate dehydrogenase family protein [Deltaproteobacteria bacterium]MBW2134896.1 prephenate dehydrogenase/arogenate dehydrogenase family protein [Deltaproteobacteria bacterium]